MNNYESFVSYVKKKDLGKIITNVNLKEYTSLHIGGIGLCMFYPHSTIHLINAFKFIVYNDLKYLVIGNGTNTLISDNYHQKIFINLKELNKTKITNNLVYVESGTNLNLLGKMVSRLGFTNLEWVAGIPGTIGGAIYMNAGAWGKEIKDYLVSVTYLDEKGNEVTKNSFNDFAYRSSPFQKNRGIIISCIIKLSTSAHHINPLDVYQKYLKEKINKEPIKQKNAGCAFKNPQGCKAWELIESSGCNHLNVNDAKVSNIHANVIINSNEASFDDMLKLIQMIKDNVYEKYQIELIPEYSIIK